MPFYFYDEFMKHNGFYDDIEEMLEDPDFQSDYDTQEKELKKLRKKIKKGETPDWIVDALEEMHATYPEGQSLRYRSSTNNEDLPGFSGAGLYDSKTQDPEETEEDGIDKSIKGVWASLWNFRAFTEREFHRIDHLATAMGVLVHPNYSDELANGVAVSFDPIYETDGSYYVNTQLGEDLVTNPDAHSVPEEILLDLSGSYTTLVTSNQVPRGQLLMSDAQIDQLRRHLQDIHDHFEDLYNPGPDEPFAMEIEFKITSDDVLSIKQARPWVFGVSNAPGHGGETPEGEAIWSATLTVGVGENFAGYSSFAQGEENNTLGALSSDTITLDDASYTVKALGVLDGKLILSVLPKLSAGFVLVVGTDEFASTDASTLEGDSLIQFQWNYPGLDLSEGEEVAVRLAAPDDGTPATGLPVITGTARVGQTLTVDTSAIADEDGLDDVSYSYQWIANDGTTDTEIEEDATDSAYTPTVSDVGKTIKVRVTFTDDADNQESLTSADTDTVAATEPGVPGHLNAFPHDAGALDVYWEAPASDGGSDITGYKVQWKESADSWDTPADVSEATASGTIHTITGLTDGVEYSVRVLATNGVGDSPPSVEQTGTPRETKAPEMVRPRVDGATLKVLYDEALDEGSAPPTDSFDVRVACTCDDTTWLDEEAKRAVESVSVDGDTVVLTLVSAATSEDVVVVSYTPPSDAATAQTRDLAGNAAAGFNSTEVFNDTDETAESEENGEPEETTEGETPLTVSLEATTESHNGTDAFTFEIRFSEEFPLSYKTLRDLAFTVSGGEVLKAQRLDKPSNIRWLIMVEPDSNGDVAVVLPVTQNCASDGAICTGDGRKLSTRLELTVSGPGQ